MYLGRIVLTLTLLARLLCAAPFSGEQDADTFHNPVLPSGPDPWVVFHDGFYYFMCSTGVNLTIWKARSIADLRTGEKKIVWTPPATGPYSHEIWAPELHRFNGRWYIYFSADNGDNMNHRVWVLENSTADPMSANWYMKGKISDAGDHWEIDGSAFEVKGQLYFIWSGWAGPRQWHATDLHRRAKESMDDEGEPSTPLDA